MKLTTLRLATGLALTAAAGISQAASFPVVDPRVAGMGGVSVATATLDSAAFYNPALLAAQNNDSNFSLNLNVGVGIADPNNLTGAASDFTNSLSSFNNLNPTQVATDPTTVQTDFNNLATAVSNLGGKSYNIATPLDFNLGFTLGGWAAALTGLGYVNAGVSVGAADGTPNLIDTRNNTSVTNFSQIQSDPTILQYLGTDAQLDFNGVVGTEVGLSLARKLDIAGLNLAVGLTPKMVSISNATGTADLNSSSSTPSLTTSSATSDFNMDAGVVWNVSNDLRVGGTIHNLISKSYGSYNMKPQVRAGVGYSTHLLTVGADMDLTENENFGIKSRILAVGAEFNAWSVMQVRAGYRKDLANNLNQISAGLGFFNSALNLALIANPNDLSKGASAYFGFGVNF